MVNDYPAYIECNDLNGNIQDIIRQAFDSLYFQILIDRTGRIVYINDSYADFFGRTKQDIIGRQIEEIIPNTKLYDVIETGTPKIDELFEFVDGRHLVYSRLPIRNSYGEIQGVITASSFNTSKQLDDLRANIDELLRSNTILTRQLYGLDQAPAVFSSIVGNSPKIKELKHTLSKVCNSTMPILLTGERGTGKEVFATAIHNASAS